METLNYFKALADITRLRLLNILLNHELSVNELVTILGMGQSGISRNLKILTETGFLECRRDGSWAFYYVTKQGACRRFIDSIKYVFNHEDVFHDDLTHTEHIIQDRKLETVRFFNKIASKWDLLKSEILGDFELNKVIIGEMRKCDVVVDLGCGTGELMQELKTVANRVIGVDSSSKMLDQARNRFKANEQEFDLRLGELEHLPLTNEEADCAVLSMVLHHLSRPELVIAELARVLKKSGTLIIVDYEKHADESMRRIYGDRWLGFGIDEVTDFLTPKGLVIAKIRSFKIQKRLTLNLFKSFFSNESLASV